MWGEIIEALIGVAVAGLAGQAASKLLTGKWLHEHLYEWWRELSEQIDAWVKENEALGIARVIGVVNRKLDNVITGANRTVKLSFYAEDEEKNRHVVVENYELSAEEVAAQFPELQKKKKTLVMEVSYGDAAHEAAPSGQIDSAQDDAVTEEEVYAVYPELRPKNEIVIEDTEAVDILLLKVAEGANKTSVVKFIRALTGAGLRDARNAIKSAPAVLLTGAPREYGEQVKAELESYGAKVALS